MQVKQVKQVNQPEHPTENTTNTTNTLGIKPKINYVIASFPGKKGSICRDKLVNVYPHPENYLREHLKKLLSLKHNLAQITIVKAKPSPTEPVWNKFYNIDDLTKKFNCPVIQMECPNFALSYGQYLHSFKKFPNFDYYCFIEEDYCAAVDNFDEVLLKIYKTHFPNNIGYLCSYAPTKPVFHAAFEFGLISKLTMQQLFEHFADPFVEFNGLKHGQIQIKFSDLFLNSGVKIEDFNKEYHTPYYKGVHQLLINCSKNPKFNIAIFIPLQMINDHTPNRLKSLKLIEGLY